MANAVAQVEGVKAGGDGVALSDEACRHAAYRKVAVRLVPFLVFLFILAWIDRVNIGFAKLQMLNDLAFSEAIYGLGAGIFFIGYFLLKSPVICSLKELAPAGRLHGLRSCGA